jgi:hypothetical protein
MDSIGHLLHHQQVFRSKSYSPNRMVHSTGTISPVISLTSAEPNEQGKLYLFNIDKLLILIIYYLRRRSDS